MKEKYGNRHQVTPMSRKQKKKTEIAVMQYTLSR